MSKRPREDPHKYIEVWSFQSSPRVKIIINRMIIPEKEREDFLNEEYLKKMESKAQYEEGKRKRIEIKKDAEKYKITSLITGWSGQPWRTKGITITRKQIPCLIEALQNIKDGDYDSFIKKILFETGTIKKISQDETDTETVEKDNAEIESEIESEMEEKENKKAAEVYSSWLQTLTDEQKKEAKKMENEGWTRVEIRDAFGYKNFE